MVWNLISTSYIVSSRNNACYKRQRIYNRLWAWKIWLWVLSQLNALQITNRRKAKVRKDLLISCLMWLQTQLAWLVTPWQWTLWPIIDHQLSQLCLDLDKTRKAIRTRWPPLSIQFQPKRWWIHSWSRNTIIKWFQIRLIFLQLIKRVTIQRIIWNTRSHWVTLICQTTIEVMISLNWISSSLPILQLVRSV